MFETECTWSSLIWQFWLPTEIQRCIPVSTSKCGDYGHTLLHLAVYRSLEIQTQILILALQTLVPTEFQLLPSDLNISFLHLYHMCYTYTYKFSILIYTCDTHCYNLHHLILSFQTCGTKDWIPVIRLGGKQLGLLSYFSSSEHVLLNKQFTVYAQILLLNSL